MINQSSMEAKDNFLHEFTKEILLIVRRQIDERNAELQRIERVKKQREIEKLKKKYIDKKKLMKRTTTVTKTKSKSIKKPMIKKKPIPKVAKPIPGILPMPASVQVPMEEFDFGKIERIINDPNVDSIECQGPGQNIIIKRRGQVMRSGIILRKEEIDFIIKDFSEKARIPLVEGLLRARINNLQISAVVSEVASSRFMIIKLGPHPIMVQPIQNQQLSSQQPQRVSNRAQQRPSQSQNQSKTLPRQRMQPSIMPPKQEQP